MNRTEDIRDLTDNIARCRGMMDPRLKSEWIAELRRSADKQAHGVLCTKEGDRCALGVLFDLYPHKDMFDLQWNIAFNDLTDRAEEVLFIEGDQKQLPPSVRKWSGLTESVIAEISDANDYLVSFEELADILEKAL